MTLDDLIAEGERIARPCFLLNLEGQGDIVGYWRGEREDQPNTVSPEATMLRSIEHIVTIDADLFRQIGIQSYYNTVGFSKVVTKDDSEHYRVWTTEASLSELKCDGAPLYATRAISFPPIEAVCLYGSDALADRLKARGLERHEYEAVEALEIASYYRGEFQARSPFYQQTADLVIGGWHMTWPDDDFYMPLEMRLALATIIDGEPHYELWQAIGRKNWSVKARIM